MDSIKYTQSKETQTEELIDKCKIKTVTLKKGIAEYQNLIEELSGTPKAEMLTDEYLTMLEEYKTYQSQHFSDQKKLQEKIEEVKKQINNIANSLKRFGLEPKEYENTKYSDAVYNYTEEKRQQTEQDYELAVDAYTQISSDFKVTKNNLEQSERKLKELNAEPLERSEVGSDFERRIKECEKSLEDANADYKKCEQLLSELIGNQRYTMKYAERFHKEISEYKPKMLEESVDIDSICDNIDECIDKLKYAEEDAKKYHHNELYPFHSEHSSFAGTIDSIAFVIGNTQINGDRYYTLYERIDNDIRHYDERIKILNSLLSSVEDNRKQLVTHCLQRVGRLYENLKILSKKSSVQIGNTKKQMIHIELPEIDSTSKFSAERINQYIIEQVKKFQKEESVNKNRNHLEIRKLLNYYIGRESIPISVYKIDKNVQNSRLRSWEDALKANSGGEQFVVLFSLIVAMMNYTRSMTDNLNHTSGVLILDNPFGPISSPHLLEPMFNIARRFHIQLICLTHIGTAAVTSCFDMVYQLRFRNLPLSNVEILESEAKQHMEHAYYLSEQLSLF